jgi:hypothetical protein
LSAASVLAHAAALRADASPKSHERRSEFAPAPPAGLAQRGHVAEILPSVRCLASKPVSADVTLNLTLINSHGAWQCSDHRVSNEGHSVHAATTKHIVLRCRDGAALIAYAGVGRKGDVEPSEWMEGILRDENRTLDDSLILLRDAATRDLGPIAGPSGIRHMFTVAAFFAGVPWLLQIRNFQDLASPARPNFESSCRKVADGGGAVSSFAHCLSVSLESRKLLESVARIRPRATENFHDLLHAIHRRTAQAPASRGAVSLACTTTFLTPDGARWESFTYADSGERRNNPIYPTVGEAGGKKDFMRRTIAQPPEPFSITDAARWHWPHAHEQTSRP